MFTKFSSRHLTVSMLANVNRVRSDCVIKRVWFPFPTEGPCSPWERVYQTLCVPSTLYGFCR